MKATAEIIHTGSIQVPRTDNPIILGIGTRIRDARESANLTQAALAKLADVSRTAVTQWEASMTFPSIEKTLELAKLLKVRPEFLAYGVNTVVEYRTLEDNAIKVPLINFGREETDRDVVETHYIDRKRLTDKNINADTGKVFFWKIETEAFAARYAPNSLLLIDGNIDWINGKGDYLIWNGSAQVVSAAPEFMDKEKSTLHDSIDGAAHSVDNKKITVLGRIRGVFN